MLPQTYFTMVYIFYTIYTPL